MRLQLAATSLCLLGLAGQAHAQAAETGEGTASSRLLVYDDDDHTTVVTAIVDAEATLPSSVSVGAYALVDAVSSASIDVVSAATERWEENRVEVGARAEAFLLGGTHRVGVGRSQENDWLSHTVSLATSRELFERNTVVSAAYAFTRNKVGRAMDPNFERSLSAQSMELSVGQLVDRKTRVGAAYSLQRLRGFQSSTYRYVVSADGGALAERHPEGRLRNSLSVFALRSLTPRSSARVSYRLYTDDWGVHSHTGTLRFVFQISEHLLAAVDGRIYKQDKADFYRRRYSVVQRYMSRDRELSSFWDAGGNAELGLLVGPVKIDAKLGLTRYRFKNFDGLAKRVALLAGGGARVDW